MIGTQAGRFIVLSRPGNAVRDPLNVIRRGLVAYEDGLRLQESWVAATDAADRDGGALILLEHPPVITIGRSGTARNILAPQARLDAEGVRVFEASRGGDVTYHGPGQIVGYPILPLKHHGKDIHRYLRDLEAVLIAALADFGIAGFRKEGYTGVWTERGKIASIGVAVRRWITYHGFALNAAPRMEHFQLLHPCGLVGVRMTCMKDFLGAPPAREAVDERIVAQFQQRFGFDACADDAPLPCEARP